MFVVILIQMIISIFFFEKKYYFYVMCWDLCCISLHELFFHFSLNNLFILQKKFFWGYKKQTMYVVFHLDDFFSSKFFHIKNSHIFYSLGERKLFYSWLNSRKRVILFLKGCFFCLYERGSWFWKIVHKRLLIDKSKVCTS
jgi:hypothetical protein